MKKTRLVGLLLLACAFAINSPAQSFLTDGLIAYYPLAGNANDASGNGYNGTPSGTTLTNNHFGESNSALWFNGATASISCSIPIIPTGTAPRTVALWAKALPNATHGANLVWWGSPQNYEGFGILNNSSPFTWQAESYGGGDDVNSGVVVDGNWHHVVTSYDGTNLSISLDGILRARDSRLLGTPSSDVLIGDGPTPNTFFTGAIDSVRIYNRALSSGEVFALWASESTSSVALQRAVRPTFSNLYVGTNYQLQATTNLGTWSNQGAAFVATNSSMAYPQYFNVTNWNQLYFRLVSP